MKSPAIPRGTEDLQGSRYASLWPLWQWTTCTLSR